MPASSAATAAVSNIAGAREAAIDLAEGLAQASPWLKNSPIVFDLDFLTEVIEIRLEEIRAAGGGVSDFVEQVGQVRAEAESKGVIFSSSAAVLEQMAGAIYAATE
jgi:hypothetical protein